MQTLKPIFWRKLDVLLKHRLPLIDALEILIKESREKFEKKLLEELLLKLKSGKTFSESIGNGDLAIKGILSAGERAGDFAGAIARLAERKEQEQKLQAQIIGATIYPCLVLLLCLALCAVLAGVVLPRFEKLFEALGVGKSLPALTQCMLNFGNFIRQDWWMLLIIFLAAGLFAKFYLKGKRLGAFLWKMPLLGALWQQSHRENFFSTLGILLQNGAPLDDALKNTADALSTTPLGDIALNACARVKEGDRLSKVLRSSGDFEESQLQLIALSEQGGNLAENCGHLGMLLRERMQVQLKTTMSVLEPSLILGMAGFVLLMVVALFLPLGPLVARLAEGA